VIVPQDLRPGYDSMQERGYSFRGCCVIDPTSLMETKSAFPLGRTIPTVKLIIQLQRVLGLRMRGAVPPVLCVILCHGVILHTGAICLLFSCVFRLMILNLFFASLCHIKQQIKFDVGCSGF
jgi:hypothetical protein